MNRLALIALLSPALVSLVVAEEPTAGKQIEAKLKVSDQQQVPYLLFAKGL